MWWRRGAGGGVVADGVSTLYSHRVCDSLTHRMVKEGKKGCYQACWKCFYI